MKAFSSRIWISVVGGLGILALAACSTGDVDSPDAEAGEDTAIAQSNQGQDESDIERSGFRLGDGELPALMQLTLGVFQLEDTELAINGDQAAEMLPLWKAYRSISQSDTVAQAELEAVVNQIQDVMSTDQLEAISAMGLTPEDTQALISDLGVEFQPPEGLEGGDFQFQPGGVGSGPGGGPGGGQGRPGGGIGTGNFDPETAATARAEAGIEGEGRGAFGSRAGIFLLDPLIEMLEERAGVEGA